MSELTDKFAFLDTENHSALMYANEFNFDHAVLEGSFGIEKYTKAIIEAEKLGYGGIILDSVTHGWNDAGGALDRVEAAASKLKGNSYAGWKDVTPSIREFLNTIVRANIHIIACFRVKTEYVDVERNGRKYKEKVGLAPIFKEGAEHEFHLVAQMDLSHNLIIEKIRQGTTKYLDDTITHSQPGEKFAKLLKTWLAFIPEEAVIKNVTKTQPMANLPIIKKPKETELITNSNLDTKIEPEPSNDVIEASTNTPSYDANTVQPLSDEQKGKLKALQLEYGIPTNVIKDTMKKYGYQSIKEILSEDFDNIYNELIAGVPNE